MRNQIAPDDIKISKEMLYAQGQVAKENGNDPMEKNFERAAELVDDGVQSLWPAEQRSGCDQHHDVSEQYVVPRIYTLLVGQEYADEISSPSAGSNVQAQADGESVDETAEQAYKHYVVSEYIWWQNIHKYTRQKNDYDRIEGKSFADIFVWYVCGK